MAWFVVRVQQISLKAKLPNKSIDEPFMIINENIDDAGISDDQNIFFIETNDSEFTQIRTRQVCSVDAAGKSPKKLA